MTPTTWARHVTLKITKTKTASQDQLIDVFKSVGQVVGFRAPKIRYGCAHEPLKERGFATLKRDHT